MENLNRFYTYAYLREDKTPYYIGKGNGDRVYRKRQKGVKPPKDKSRIIFLKQNLTEEEAFKHEKYMIAVFGRKDLETGILHNRTNGGEGGSGLIHSEETKRKLSEVGKIYGKINGKLGGIKAKELGLGVFSMTKEERTEASKRSAETNRKNKTGIFAQTKEDKGEVGKKGCAKNKKNRAAIFALTKEQLSNQGKKTNAQKWICLETGFIANPGNLTQYQRARGINTSKNNRKKIS